MKVGSASLLQLFFLLSLLFCPVTSAQQPPIVQVDFEKSKFPGEWRNEGSGSATLEPGPGGSRVMEVETTKPGTHLISIPIPLDAVRGLRVTLSARVKAENVSKPPQPWNGIKLMLHTVGPKGPSYESVMDLHGTFDWKQLGLTAVIPADATEAFVMLGLQDCRGKAWFDDVSLVVSAKLRKRPAPQPEPLSQEKLDRRSDLPRLRGVMYGPKGKAEDLRELAKWNANLIRWQFYWYDGSFPEKRLDLARYDLWLEQTIADLDALLPLCKELGIRVVIDLHTPPGGTDSGQMTIFQQQSYQKKFIEVWDRLANHYKDKETIWGYDLLNEPVEGKVAEGLLDWHSLAGMVAKRVRAIDPKRAIFVEPGPSGGWGNLPFFEPFDVPGIVYSVHVYDPLQFTHQGVLEGMPVGPVYPGLVEGVVWNKEKLREKLEPVRQFQKDYNVPIYIGEFSAIRWAPDDSAARYLSDCIELFEEFGWDWSYHAFREWQGWNVELGSSREDQSPASSETSREKVLREGFSKN